MEQPQNSTHEQPEPEEEDDNHHHQDHHDPPDLYGEDGPSQSTMEQMMLDKATELFRLCDTEQKGFITKRDMQRMRSELPIEPDQLEIVFDSLDEDKNGYLTLEEFTEGFGSFLGLKPRGNGNGKSRDERCDGEDGVEERGDVFEGAGGEQADANRVFEDMMMHNDCRGVFMDEDVVKAMWMKLHSEEPDLVSTFEEFLGRTASEIKKSRGEFHTLEGILKSKTLEHEDEVKKLYEEMEYQMKREQDRILTEEKAKEKQLREEMEAALKEKERQLIEMQNRHQEMEDRLAKLNLMEANTKQENQRLMQEKESLEELLTESQDSLEESRSYIAMLQTQQRDEKKERARAALQLSEGIALERETLVKQLGMLKDVNKRLLDDKDEADAIEARREDSIHGEVMSSVTALAQQAEEPQKQRKLVKQGSLLSKYFPGGPAPQRQRSEALSEDLEGTMADLDDDDGIEMDDLSADMAQIYTFHRTNHHALTDSDSLAASVAADIGQKGAMGGGGVGGGGGGGLGNSVGEGSEDMYSALGHRKGVGKYSHRSPGFGRLMHEDSYTSDAESEAVLKKTAGLVGSQTESVGLSEGGIEEQPSEEVMKRQRIFKVVFVGDSGVGKSSFIHRFCSNTFRATFSATIGVDFQVKPITVDDNIVVLQLWDTAGQERYRSVTKQYFRKADGVIIMYDITSEQSFLNVRQWMDSVQEGVEDGTVLAIIGNKTDLVEQDPELTKVKDGARMAVEYNALFYETSAKSNSYISEAMLGLASLLKDKEDKALEAAVKLTDPPKKKGCCK
ncbi:EF-hand calcium-binding domain-containing protein 4B-like isoform X2 [Babylonia areolata]|uniref:EF-hand calcium-binding domain-containing protein 4B-like isoform X2 n=1 Tax=Babylonia areolata TaxID=304850 RepID=UPI003FD39BFE